MKKILLTGANGFIGSALAEALGQRNDCEVIASSRKTFKNGKNCQFIQADLAKDCEVLSRIKPVDCVIHCAGQTGLSANSKIFEQNNYQVTKNLIDLTARWGVDKFIFISTPSIYMGPESQSDIREADIPKNLLTSYATSKLNCEKYLLSKSQNFNSVVILRPGTVFGRGNQNLKSAVLKMRGMNKVFRIGESNPVVSVTSLDNLVEAIQTVVLSEKEVRGVFNFADEEPVNLTRVLLKDYFEDNGVDYKTVRLPFRPFYLAGQLIQKVYQGLGIIQEPFLSPYYVCNLGRTRILNISKFRECFNYRASQPSLAGVNEFKKWLEE